MTTGDPRGARTGPEATPDLPARLVAAVPEPRPEILVRVLAGLRELPDAPPRSGPEGSSARTDTGAGEPLPLPRRHA